jgi:hypothetical protein
MPLGSRHSCGGEGVGLLENGLGYALPKVMQERGIAFEGDLFGGRRTVTCH